MYCKDYLRYWFGRAWKDIDADVQGLTDKELEWVPAGGKHSIKALYYHMIEAVDGWQVGTLEATEYKWGAKLGDWESEEKLPDLGVLQAYRDEVHKRFVDHLDRFSHEALSEKVRVFRGNEEVPVWWVYGPFLSTSIAIGARSGSCSG
jgi:uncharacterized damage-inducible protein DinB